MGAEVYRELLARPLVEQGGKKSYLSPHLQIAATVDLLENKEFHTKGWVQACAWAWLIGFFGRSVISKFDNKALINLKKDGEKKVTRTFHKEIFFSDFVLMISEKWSNVFTSSQKSTWIVIIKLYGQIFWSNCLKGSVVWTCLHI